MKKMIASILAAAMIAAAVPVIVSAETTYEVTTPEEIEGGAVYMSLGTPDSGIPFINDDGETEYEAAENTEFFAEGEAQAGAEITVYVIADDGYELMSLTVSGDNVSYTIEDGITAVSEDEYSFVMPAEAVTVIPEFAAASGTMLSYDAQSGKLTVTSDTDHDNAKLIIAEYTDDGILAGIAADEISISAGTPVSKDCRTGNIYNTKFMLWDGLGTIIPLANPQYEGSANAASRDGVTVDAFGTGTNTKPQITVSGEGANGQLAAADVTLEGETLDGTAELRIKYDAGRGLDASTLLPQYFNTETGGWENIPYMIDEDNNEAMILTDHFSNFALFYKDMFTGRTNLGHPDEMAVLDPSAVASMKQQTADTILGKFNKGTTTLTEDTVSEVLDSLDGAFNGKLMTTGGAVATVKTHYTGETAGKLNKSFTKGLGNSFTMVGAVGACISLANTAYKKGVFTTESGVAAVNAVAGIAVNFASWPVQVGYLAYSLAKMGHDHYEAKELKKTNKQIERAFGVYKQSNKKSMEDWKAVFDKCYEKYYTNGTKGTPTENFARFDKALRNTISGHAYQYYGYYNDYGKSLKWRLRMRIPEPDETTNAIVSDLCANYEAEIMQSLTSMFLSYSRKAYNDAIKAFDEECQEVSEKLNGYITLNFVESEENNMLPENGHVWLRFAGTVYKGQWRLNDYRELWTVSYPKEQELKFTLLSYIQLGCPDRITAYDNEFNAYLGDETKSIGYVELPDGLEPGKSFDVPLTIKAEGTKTILLHEEKVNSSDDYLFAGLSGRLVDINDSADEKDYRFTLDERGQARLEIDLAKYCDDGEPDTIEISDTEGNVIYQTAFSIAMTDIPLGGDVYTVSICCNDDSAKESYKDNVAKVEYIDDYSEEPVTIAAAKLNENGKALIMFERSKYEFFGKNLVLNIYGADGESVTASWDLKDAFNDEKKIMMVALGGSDPEEPTDPPRPEAPKFKESSVDIAVGGSATLTLVSGYLSSIVKRKSGNPAIATVESITIYGLSEGSTVVTFEDEWGGIQKISVTVIDNRPRVYRISQIYQRQIVEKYGTDDEFTWEPGERSPHYVRVYSVRDGSGVITFMQIGEGIGHENYRLEGSGMYLLNNTGGYYEEQYLENWNNKSSFYILHDNWNLGGVIIYAKYIAELTGFDAIPPEGTTGLGW